MSRRLRAIQIFIIGFLILNVLSQNITDNNTTESATDICRADRKLTQQPEHIVRPEVKKCCRDEENLYILNSTVQNYGCERQVFAIFVNYSIVDLYLDCLLFRNRSGGEILLKDGEKPPNYDFFPCRYYGDLYGTHILQNGSLLVTNTYGLFYYRISNDFCLDADANSGMYMVCHDVDEAFTIPLPSESPKPKSKNVWKEFFTIISIPCLIGIVLMYIFIKDFRNIHGICVISLCSFMTIEYILRSVLSSLDTDALRHTVQYFDLVHHFWILVLFVNTMLFVWVYIPFHLVEWRYFGIYSYAAFFVCCLAIPSIISNQLQDDEIRTLLDYFTTPKTTIILLCVILLMTIFMGSNRLAALIRKEILEKYYSNPSADHESDIIRHHFCFEEIQHRLTCLTSLAGLMVVVRVFYIPGHSYLIILRELLTSLQGIFFVLIFLGLRYKDIRNFAWSRFKK